VVLSEFLGLGLGLGVIIVCDGGYDDDEDDFYGVFPFTGGIHWGGKSRKRGVDYERKR
jgi:hypothetical protein